MENLEMTTGFWFGRRVLITGHTGFKGSWLSLWLQNLGAIVSGYSLQPPTNPSLFVEARVHEGITSIEGDIQDFERFSRVVKSERPDVIFHMAAQSLVRNSYLDPIGTYSTNVMGTIHLLEAIRRTPSVRAVVVVTTDKCYENKEWEWGYRESDRLGGHDPYSSSKACAELVANAYRASFFSPLAYESHKLGLATARAGNVIGGGDWARGRLIPDIIAAFKRGEKVVIRNPASTRPWQHVLEPLRGYLMLAENLVKSGAEFSESWNFGPISSDSKPVKLIVEKMMVYWGDSSGWELDNSENPHEAGSLKLDISKVDNRLNWKPLLNLDEALKLNVDWSKSCQNGRDPKEVTLEQICNYQNKI
jgi:CDP-glucose 4,6-dehydratase